MRASYPRQRALIENNDKYMGIQALDDLTHFLNYRRVYTEPQRHYQSFSQFWLLMKISNFEPGSVFLKTADHCVEISGSVFLFIPAFTYVEWLFMPGVYEYEAYSSYEVVSDELPRACVLFPYEDNCRITGYADIVDLLRGAEDSQLEDETSSYVVEKTKSFLDRFFYENLSFEEIAKDLHIPYSTMAMGFKKHFGLPPIAYRNILRTFEAYRLIRNGETVTRAGLEAGFTGLTQYNQNFHRVFGAPPSSFLT